MYDESYRTPLLISWPGAVEPNTVNNDLVSNLDFAQTFLEIAGVEAPSAMQGQSLVPVLKQQQAGEFRDYHYYHYYEYPGWHMVQRHEGVYDGRYKLISFYDLDEWELIDTEVDPHELTNVYFEPEYVDVLDRMKQALDQVKAKYKVPEGKPTPREVKNPYHFYSSQRLSRTQREDTE